MSHLRLQTVFSVTYPRSFSPLLDLYLEIVRQSCAYGVAKLVGWQRRVESDEKSLQM